MAARSVSGRHDSVLVIESGAGGRIYKQAAGGQQVSWGTVVVSEPAARLVCQWLAGDTLAKLEVRCARHRRRDGGRDRAPGLGTIRPGRQ